MSTLATSLQAWFTDRLIRESDASPPLGPLELVAQRSTHGQVLGHRIVQGAHRVAPGHGRAICLSASRSTLA